VIFFIFVDLNYYFSGIYINIAFLMSNIACKYTKTMQRYGIFSNYANFLSKKCILHDFWQKTCTYQKIVVYLRDFLDLT